MPDLTIRIKKKSDGSAALSCLRANGTTTWQQQNGQLGLFFPLHDLTHYAVESVLGLRRAFFGLVAEGWDFTDFASAGARERLSEDARTAEWVVGIFDLERATGVLGSADEYTARLQEYVADNGLPAASFRLTEEQIGQIRLLRRELFDRWEAVPAGDALVLRFCQPAYSGEPADTNPQPDS